MEIADDGTLERMGDVSNVSETAERSGKELGGDSVDVMDGENREDEEDEVDMEVPDERLGSNEDDSEDMKESVGRETNTQPVLMDETGDADTAGGDPKGKKQQRLIQFPLARVKGIIKSDPDIAIVSQDTVFLVTKATELFVKYLSGECLRQTQEAKRKVIQRKDLDNPLKRNDCLMFLEGCMD